eukprot:TRINITY_DN29523_c0_g1_i1.p1 TRINITY_DN29523_c0_g1~~TRINITY_DN29523_c0_g1_i1.p1  ORF type:complete len:1076 (+),score=269.84 TRINITY_DN29523_c0_g1_i1:60-3287(+)
MPLQKLSAAVRGGAPPASVPPSASAVSASDQLLLLPSERAAQTLRSPAPAPAPATAAAAASAAEGSGATSTKRVYRWIEFANKGEQVTEFDESHFELQGHFESNSSEGHKSYQDRLRAIHFRKEGKSKAEIAKLLGRSEQFVAKWWQKDEREVPRPWGVHEYMSKELGSQTSTNQALLSEGSETSTATWWRDVEVRRKYHAAPEIYEELLNNTEWRSSAARTRDFSTGASHVKYDKEGNMKLQGNQGAKYKKGSSPAFDKLLQKFFAEYGIVDRTAGIALNWYPDGDGVLGSHRHDCWTALFSFGHERILTIDKTPLLLQDADLVIFGTQRHGVPKMPEVKGGRITVPIFFYPDHLQMKKQWQTLTDPEDPRRSRDLAKLQFNNQLNSDTNQLATWADPSHLEALQRLLQLGFDDANARLALQTSSFDVERAVEVLLLSGAGGAELDLSLSSPALADVSDATTTLLSRAGRWGPGRSQRAIGSSKATPQGPDDDSAGNDASGAVVAPEDVDDASLALALELQQESECGCGCPSHAAGFASAFGDAGPLADAEADADAAAALALQLAEEEELGGAQDHGRVELLAQQFQEYEDQMKREDAEKWHGKGDLMQSNFARDTLSLETMDKVECYSIGHGQLKEKVFYELLQLNSIRVLYDFRASDHRGEVHSPCEHFSVRALKSQCRTRGITYKHVALGRESAYGILKHIKTDEAKHALIELLWQSKRSRTCFMGFDVEWRNDSRQIVAEELCRMGHVVNHIDCTGATEKHETGRPVPDFIIREEERLRKLEKQRQAGELHRPEKSATDRSSEAVASKLMKPSREIDAMDELRAASNQVELERAQRNLARLQRLGDKHGALANKVVKAAPQWILDEAMQQEAWISNKKAEKESAALKAKEKAVDAKAAGVVQDSCAEESEELLVECLKCRVEMPWSQLAQRDGICSSCTDGDAEDATATSGGKHEHMTEAISNADDVLVQCSLCTVELPWSKLCPGDGICPKCLRGREADEGPVAGGASSSCTVSRQGDAPAERDEPSLAPSVSASSSAACLEQEQADAAPARRSSWRGARRAVAVRSAA